MRAEPSRSSASAASAVRRIRRCAKRICSRGSAITPALLSLAALKDADDAALIAHCERVAAHIPLVGFYLQPSVGGRALSYAFWRRFAEIPDVVAIKIAPFNRYQTLDVVRAVVDARRDDIALYTGNDDAIVSDLVTTFRFAARWHASRTADCRWAAGPLGGLDAGRGRAASTSVTRQRVAEQVPAALLARGVEVTDANSAFFDAANGFAGCIAGIQEVLRRQGLLASARCLDPARDAQRRTGGRNRSRVPRLPAPGRR